jgi:hypothetical protein
MLANMRYHTNVIISLFTALGALAASSRKLMKTGAYALRIAQLQDVAAEIAAGAAGPWPGRPLLTLAVQRTSRIPDHRSHARIFGGCHWADSAGSSGRRRRAGLLPQQCGGRAGAPAH